MTRAELSDMIALADRLLAAEEVGVLATLFSSNGSTYRPLGAMMVSGPGSISAGGVSGGCVEEYVARHGRTIVQQRPAAMLSFDADPDGDDDKPSLGCGGSIEVLVERLTPGHAEFLRRFDLAYRADQHSTAACVLAANALDVTRTWFDEFPSPGTRGEGRVRVFSQTRQAPSPQPSPGVPGEGEMQQLAPLRLQAIETAQSRHGTIEDANRRALVYYIPAMTRLVILGGGDDAKPLCTLARSLGWHVTVADRRARLATRERFSDADDVIATDWQHAIDQISFTPRTAVVMMTHSIADDVELLPYLDGKAFGYLGALGPAHRRQWVLDGANITSGPLADKLRGPIGLNLGDRSPAGIAVSVTAEILAELTQRDAAPLSGGNPVGQAFLPAIGRGTPRTIIASSDRSRSGVPPREADRNVCPTKR
jgi:xanthine/CO dehydrogenase XdhC/CoxF family maturation factor